MLQALCAYINTCARAHTHTHNTHIASRQDLFIAHTNFRCNFCSGTRQYVYSCSSILSHATHTQHIAQLFCAQSSLSNRRTPLNLQQSVDRNSLTTYHRTLASCTRVEVSADRARNTAQSNLTVTRTLKRGTQVVRSTTGIVALHLYAGLVCARKHLNWDTTFSNPGTTR